MFPVLCAAEVLDFEHDTLDVKAGVDAKIVESEYKFTNNTGKVLTIRQADAGCSCLAAEVAGGKMEYAPGESGVLRTTFEVGAFQGVVDKPIYIWLKGDPEEEPSTTLHLRVHVPVVISLEPKTLKWQVGDKGEAKRMDVKIAYEKPVKVKSVTSSQEKSFKVELITLEDGKHYQVEVTPLNTSAPALSIIRIETDIEVEKQKVQQGFATMTRALK